MTRHATTEPQQDVSTLASFALLGGLLAVVLSFFAPSFAIVLALIVIVMGVIALIRVRLGRPGKGPAIAAIVLAVIALLIGGAMSPDAEDGFRQATGPTPDPNALPATVVIADVRSPEHLVTTEGRQLHVTTMQDRVTSDPCRTGTDLATARQLVIGRTVSVALPDVSRSDVASAVPPGFQPVVMTLADGFDYAQTWRSRAANAWYSACVPAPVPAVDAAPVSTRARPDRDSSDDVDRPATRAPETRDAPAPRTRESSGTRERTGQSGHLCRPGERDGDDDGYCGE